MNPTTSLQKYAYRISGITHPLFMPVIGFMIFNQYNYTSFTGQSFFILMGVFTITVVALPAYLIFSLKRGGYIQSYDMETLQERRLPLLFTAFALLFNYYLMQRANMLQLYQWYFLSASIAGILALGISLFYKVSLHTIGMGFLFGLGLLLSYSNNLDMRWYLILVLLLTGLVATSRLILKAHTLPQIYLGFSVGTFSAAGMLLFL